MKQQKNVNHKIRPLFLVGINNISCSITINHNLFYKSQKIQHLKKMASTGDWRFSVVDGDLDAGCTIALRSVPPEDIPNEGEDSSNHHQLQTAVKTVKFGSEGKLEWIKYEGSDEAGNQRVYKGPSAGIDFGLILTEEEKRVAAMAEFSAGSATLSAGTLNLNANTGVKFGLDGVKFALFGFGATMGYRGVYSIDTPIGSINAQPATPQGVQNFETYATRA